MEIIARLIEQKYASIPQVHQERGRPKLPPGFRKVLHRGISEARPRKKRTDLQGTALLHGTVRQSGETLPGAPETGVQKLLEAKRVAGSESVHVPGGADRKERLS